jgi:phosphotriesterase-related protein
VSAVRTVLGDIPAAEFGVCDAHDHLFFRSRQLPGAELDDPIAATAELRAFQDLGGGSLVQWTPFGLGRRPADLVDASRATGVHVVAATGLHQAAHYAPATLRIVPDRLAELFIRELTHGLRSDEDPDVPAGAPRAGVIKVAGTFHGVDAHARWTMLAAAEAHHATGAPVCVHHELGTGAPEVLDLLHGELGVPATRIVLGHLNRSPDTRMLLRLAESGAFLAFDGPSRANHATDWRLFDLLAALVEAGHANQLLLGGDSTTAAARAASGGGPGIPYLLTSLRPRLEREFGADVVAKILIANPARAFAVDWR